MTSLDVVGALVRDYFERITEFMSFQISLVFFSQILHHNSNFFEQIIYSC